MKKVLFLASNPRGTPNLDINDEIRQARNSLRRSEFEIDTRQAVSYDDLRIALTQVKPRIVHFSGHGSGFQGLVLEDDEGQSRLISTKVLAGLFGIPSIYQNVECIVLNACFSEVQAKAICKHINYVIGMNREVQDDAAIAFTTGFYDALGDGESIENAFQFGQNALEEELSNTISNHRGIEVVSAEPTTDDSVPVLLKKEPPLVPFENGSAPKPVPSPPVPSPPPSPINRQKFLRWAALGGMGVIVAVVIHLLKPTPTPHPTSPPTPPERLSTPGLTITYYPKRDEAAVRNALESLGLGPENLKPGPSNPDLKDYPTNAIWFDSSVNFQDVKLVAESLLKAKIPIQVIEPFRDASNKPLVIEVAVKAKARDRPVFTVDQVRNAKEFRREE